MKMKKCFLLFCAVVLLCSQLLAAAGSAEVHASPTAPYTRIDPDTGKTYDLKGKTVYLYDWWSGDWHDVIPQTEEAQKTYKYRQWLEKTYNCKIVTGVKGDWGTQVDELAKYVASPDKNLCIFIVDVNFMNNVVLQGLAADWKKSVSVSLSDSKWNRSTIKMMTFAGGVYGVAAGKSEPRQVLFFNKRVLEEAGVDWNSLYNMQSKGTWTWSAWLKVMKKVQRDLDNDGENDVFGVTGKSDDLYRIAVFSNGGSLFDLDDSGELVSTAGSAQSTEALNWAKSAWKTYSAPRPEGAESWNWYEEFWTQGSTAFYIGQAWQGFNASALMSGLADPWGCVAFPKGPKGSDYVTIVENNVAVIPGCYSKQQISQVSMIYDLWTSTAPDLPDEEDDLGEYLGFTDDRAVYETYDMLRNSEHGVPDMTNLLGSVNDVLGVNLLWSLTEEDLEDLLASAAESWDQYLSTLKKIIRKMKQEKKNNTVVSGDLKYELDPSDKTAKVIGGKDKNITKATIPDTIKVKKKTYKVTTVADQAFKGYKKLKKAAIGKNIRSLGKEAFSGCVKLTSVSGGAGLVVIGDCVFKGCTALPAITLDKKVASIGDEAFCNCGKLTKYTILTTKLNDDVIGRNAFKNTSRKAVFDVPDNKVKAYKKAFQKKGADKKAKFK